MVGDDRGDAADEDTLGRARQLGRIRVYVAAAAQSAGEQFEGRKLRLGPRRLEAATSTASTRARSFASAM